MNIEAKGLNVKVLGNEVQADSFKMEGGFRAKTTIASPSRFDSAIAMSVPETTDKSDVSLECGD